MGTTPPVIVQPPDGVDGVTFEEAMTRARAAHVKVETFRQPGNNYRTEHRCSCRAFVFAGDWEAHVLAAADALMEGREFKPTMYGLPV